jgi:uncharacterized protein (DUF1778 family)
VHILEMSPMAAATERVAVLMSPEDKRAIEAKAAVLGISVGELMRRGAASYDQDTDTVQIAAMLQALTASHVETLAALEEAERELAETRRYFAAKRQIAA